MDAFKVVTRPAAVFGGLLMVEYHKSSAAKASHWARRCGDFQWQFLDFQLDSASGVTPVGDPRFLVPQYEGAPTGVAPRVKPTTV